MKRVVPAAEYSGRNLSGFPCSQEWCWKGGSLVPGECWWQVLLVLPSARECGGVSPQGPYISFRGNLKMLFVCGFCLADPSRPCCQDSLPWSVWRCSESPPLLGRGVNRWVLPCPSQSVLLTPFCSSMCSHTDLEKAAEGVLTSGISLSDLFEP